MNSGARILTMIVAAGATMAIARTAAADAYLRIIAQQAPVRSGPGTGYREIYVAHRGQVFAVLERSTRDYWFKIDLDDGTEGWIVGDAVFPFEVVEDGAPGALTRAGRAIKSTILGPSPVAEAQFSLAFSAGVLGNDGVFILRPSYLLDPYLAVEAFLGLSPRDQEDIFLYGLGFTLRMIPGAVIGPYASLGLGAAYIRPKADNFVDVRETQLAVSAGGGLEITLKKQITVRLDVRNWTLFDQNKASEGQEYTGGLAIFF